MKTNFFNTGLFLEGVRAGFTLSKPCYTPSLYTVAHPLIMIMMFPSQISAGKKHRETAHSIRPEQPKLFSQLTNIFFEPVR